MRAKSNLLSDVKKSKALVLIGTNLSVVQNFSTRQVYVFILFCFNHTMVIHSTLLKVRVKQLKRNQSDCSSFDKALADLF